MFMLGVISTRYILVICIEIEINKNKKKTRYYIKLIII